MDESFSDLERELQLLRPAKPSAALASRIEAQMRNQRRHVTGRLTWLVLPIAAAAVFIFSMRNSSDASSDRVATGTGGAPKPAVFQVVGSENVLLNAQDEGVTTLPDGTPARRVRETYLATVVWKDPKTEASLQWTMPREEFRIIPISLQ